jgi:glycosyltransferase involved in cell wall biosynthesis
MDGVDILAKTFSAELFAGVFLNGIFLRMATKKRRNHLNSKQLTSSSILPFSENDPMVSVVVPTCNRPDMLRNALSDIAHQTYQNVEAVVFNDGGPEIQDIGADFIVPKMLRIINHKENVGPAAARNFALEQAKGEIITYLDDDDRWLPFHIETVVNAMKQHAAKVVYTNVNHAYRHKREGEWRLQKQEEELIQDFHYADLLVKNFIPLICVGHTKRHFEQRGGFHSSFTCLEDWEWLLRLTANTKVFHVPIVTAVYQHFEGEAHVNAVRHDALDNTLRIYAMHPMGHSPRGASKRHLHLAALANAIRIDRRCRLPYSFTERMSQVSQAVSSRNILLADKILLEILIDLPADGELLILHAGILEAMGKPDEAKSIRAAAGRSDPYVFPLETPA